MSHEVRAVCERHGQPVSLFGHASVGLVHIRPLHDLHRPEEISRMKQIQAEVFPLVKKYGGSWSGEHGDGIVRGGYNRDYFGDEIYTAFLQVKRLFDPEGRMNPGKIIATPPMDSHLRYPPAYRPLPHKARFRYPEPGGLLAAAEQCSGVGACRKTLTGVMCPSYMASRDELHSTRGRANALRMALTGQLDAEGLSSSRLAKAMDLCLACTGCKAECPNGVDMARLKAEVLQARHDRHGVALRTRLFAAMDTLRRWGAGPQARLINPLMRHPATRWLLGHVLALEPSRPFPPFATQRLSQWYAQRPSQPQSAPPIIFFNDCYTESYLPQVGRAAIECLEKAGYSVILATVGESQRITISQGLLDSAKKRGQRMLVKLAALTDSAAPIVMCEPSSASALMHSLPDLVEDAALASRIAGRVVMFDALLERGLAAGQIQFKWQAPGSAAFVVHGHCHQKTLDGGRWTHKLLSRIPGARVSDTGAGCCGMAGSFGYEREHADLSKQIAGQRLLSTLNQLPPNAIIVTNGFSCRHQIADLTPRRPVHIAEALLPFIQ